MGYPVAARPLSSHLSKARRLQRALACRTFIPLAWLLARAIPQIKVADLSDITTQHYSCTCRPHRDHTHACEPQ